jgi:hypothetical protein
MSPTVVPVVDFDLQNLLYRGTINFLDLFDPAKNEYTIVLLLRRLVLELH